MRVWDRIGSLRYLGRQVSTGARSFFHATTTPLKCQYKRVERHLLAAPAGQLIVRTVRELGADDASHLAAGVAYYAVLSLFPLSLGLIAILGLFLPSETLQEDLFEFFQENLPGYEDVLEDNIKDVIRLRGTLGILSIVGLFWTASAMFGAISRAINRAWDIHQDRPFYLRKLRDITMAMGVSVLFLLSLGASSVSEIVGNIDLPIMETAATWGATCVAFSLDFAIFLLLYKFIPNTRTLWRSVWPGALLATILFVIAENLFIFYLSNVADYESVYGSVGSIIALLVWVYVSAFILILGAEFSSEYGRLRDTPSGGSSLDSGLHGNQSRGK